MGLGAKKLPFLGDRGESKAHGVGMCACEREKVAIITQ
jgi:hypothetical protein